MATNSWADKFFKKSDIDIKTIEKPFWGFDVGDKMLIPTPQLIEDYINQSEYGMPLDVQVMRNDLAITHEVDFTCPLTTGIFLRIVAEYHFEQLNQNSLGQVCPFWRIIDSKSKLIKKLSFGSEFILKKRSEEGLPL